VQCPECRADATWIRGWRAATQILYVCGKCEATWTVAVDPVEEAKDVIAKIKDALS
jgi:hypothetical protein